MPRRDPLAGHQPDQKSEKERKLRSSGSAKTEKTSRPAIDSKTSRRVAKNIPLHKLPAEDVKLLLHGPAPDAKSSQKTSVPNKLPPPPKSEAPSQKLPVAASFTKREERVAQAEADAPIPRERMFSYQVGFLSLLSKALFATLFGLLLSLQLPYRGMSSLPISATQGVNTVGPLSTEQAKTGTANAQSAGLPTLRTTDQNALYFDPAGCQKPADDYRLETVNGWKLNERTIVMLHHAAEMYNGIIDIQKDAITKGGYLASSIDATVSPGDSSIGTHNGGGVVDISVQDPRSGVVRFQEIEPLIRALRAAGFAAWYRDATDGYEGNEHVHAVAIGDKDLSRYARDQLTGSAGYFRGSNGLPDAQTAPDRHGGPIVCQWMIDAGYSDLRSPVAISGDTKAHNTWQEDLKKAAESYITTTPDETAAMARRIGWTRTGNEDASNMCGPLAAAILRDARLLPVQAWPENYLKDSFWLANPRKNGDGRPWIFFPQDEYEVSRYTTPINKFAFESDPLCPGDFLYLYSNGKIGDDHMIAVSEVDSKGRAYAVTNNITGVTSTGELIFLIQKVLLYDPANPYNGVFRKDWVEFENGTPRLQTGLGGFDLLRKRGSCMKPGESISYAVRPGDTLPKIAARFFSTVPALIDANGLTDPTSLTPGKVIQIPVNLTLDPLLGNTSATGK